MQGGGRGPDSPARAPAAGRPGQPPSCPALPARPQGLLAACLAVLVFSAAGAAAQPCSAEADCIAKACTEAYAKDASTFPYTVDYTTTGDALTTTFVWKVGRGGGG